MLSRFKMSQKLIGGFLLVILMLSAAIVAQILAMEELDRLQDEVANRMEDVRKLSHVMETLDMSYGTVADAIINRQLDRSKQELAELERDVAKNTAELLALVDTNDEKGWANEHIENFKAYLAIFKDEVLPTLEAQAGAEVLDAASLKAIRAMDDRIDEKRESADAPLAKIILSLEDETEKADARFDAVKNRSSTLAAVITVLTAALSMVIAYFLTRSISLPLNDSIKNLDSASTQIAAAASEISSSSHSLADGASEQASSLEETSASLEELNSMTRQNADNAAQADTMMRQALATIDETNTAMDAMDRSMNEISVASEQTNKIIKTIDEIAFQTNLLALNAAVEAARAGEAGAGFAVVADEVRNLAMRATEAAKNTAQLIEQTVQSVNSGKGIVGTVTVAFRDVAESSSKVGHLLAEISTASKEQAQGLTQISQAISQMDSVTQQNAASSEQSAAAAEEWNSQAAAMIDIVAALRSVVDGRKDAPRQAMQTPPARATQQAVKPRAVPSPAPSTKRPALAAPPASKLKKPTPPPPKAAASGKIDPESVIPMDDEGDFQDF